MAGQQHDVVSGEQYRYALTNFRIAHEKVEQQRVQLEEQEKQVALLRERIATLEGTNQLNEPKTGEKQGGYSVDDFSIKNAASRLERQINRWATELIRTPPVEISELRDAVLSDIFDGGELEIAGDARPMELYRGQRPAYADPRTHICPRSDRSRRLAAPDLLRGRRQMLPRDVALHPRRAHADADAAPQPRRRASATAVLDAAVEFSRMLHGSPSSAGGTVDAFYRSFVPEIGSTLYPRQ
ncbi:hypothetical protein EWM64_g9774, partial [Hericium alpestre]